MKRSMGHSHTQEPSSQAWPYRGQAGAVSGPGPGVRNGHKASWLIRDERKLYMPSWSPCGWYRAMTRVPCFVGSCFVAQAPAWRDSQGSPDLPG